MYALYQMNTDELNSQFVEAIKAQFPHKMIEIVVSETTQIQQNETAYLLSNSVNKAHLLKAIASIESQQLIDVDLDNL
jgi:hypothetical protein